jgi:hypothetical protein
MERPLKPLAQRRVSDGRREQNQDQGNQSDVGHGALLIGRPAI